MNTYTYDNTGIHMADKDGTVISYIKDYHGSIVGTANSSGKFLQEYNEVVYEAFGNLWDGETPDNFGYSGEYRDDESGLIYLRNRYYDSRSGRFITEDPAQDGLNWYVYAANNPISFVDPSGLTIISGEGGVVWKSQIPSYYDWDRDGRMDSDLDKARFDTNNNNIADWHDAGYDTIDAWHADMTVNELVDFPFISQYGDTCWAADIGMVSWYFTDCATTDIAVAKRALDNDDFNKSQTIPEILAHLRDGGFLNGSGYEVNENTFNHMGDDQETVEAFIKEQIDAGKPMILEMSEPGYEHVVVISRYDYSSSEEKKIKVYDSALSGQLTNNCSYSMTLDEITPIPNMSSHRIISFNRIG